MRHALTCLALALLAAPGPADAPTAADQRYRDAIARADADLLKAKAKAHAARLTAYQTALKAAQQRKDAAAITHINGAIQLAQRHGPAPEPAQTERIGKSRYARLYTPATWHAAQQHCRRMGGHLACFETDAERKAVAAGFRLQPNRDALAWIGATDDIEFEQWTWTTHGDRVDNAPPSSNDPIHALAFDSRRGAYVPADPGYRHEYICEWPD